MVTLVVICLGWCVGCDQLVFKDDLQALIARGELRLLTRNTADCYYVGPHGPTGFEYELAKQFADSLGVELTPVVVESEREMIDQLLDGHADLIAAGFPISARYGRHLALGPGYLDVKWQVIGRRGGPEINSPADLEQVPIWVPAGPSREAPLAALRQTMPTLNWLSVSDYNAEELLGMVWQKALPLTVAESHIVSLHHRYYPELIIHFDIGKPQQLAWAMPPHSRQLQAAVKEWFERPNTAAKLSGLIEHYYGHLEKFDYVDLIKYGQRIRRRLPQYRTYFEDAAAKYGLDWQLVAAQGYQESHWNPRARSFTGVRGIMMLTLETARDMGIKSRLDPKQSIFAGTRYLARLHDQIGETVSEPDRTFMALAAYNLGLGHIKDARLLAEQTGKDPHTWHDIRAVLPLLHQKKYYRHLPNGYARGKEAVQYVDRIRTYHQVLAGMVRAGAKPH
jgi:membrane-bound lytic murein transglycosylase F